MLCPVACRVHRQSRCNRAELELENSWHRNQSHHVVHEDWDFPSKRAQRECENSGYRNQQRHVRYEGWYLPSMCHRGK